MQIYESICRLVSKQAKVLDLGCGNGELLDLLKQHKKTNGTGIEISPEGVQKSITVGLSVIQGDLEKIVPNYPDKSFDFCILSQTLQELHNPASILRDMLRISEYSIIAFSNVAHIRHRMKILFRGRFPQTINTMFVSVRDFQDFCSSNDIRIVSSIFLTHNRKINWWPSIRAELCIFKIGKK
jgi:methionine biosynthesis protein MetW